MLSPEFRKYLKQNLTRRNYLIIVFMLITVGFVWTHPIHELSHTAACAIEGFQPSTNLFDLTDCPGIETASQLAYFLYAIAPYMVDLAALILIIYLLRFAHIKGLFKASGLLIVAFFILCDTLGNYLGSFGAASDFVKIAVAAPSFYWIGVGIVTMIFILEGWLFLKFVWPRFRIALKSKKNI